VHHRFETSDAGDRKALASGNWARLPCSPPATGTHLRPMRYVMFNSQ
jgi:hypothetical protein